MNAYSLPDRKAFVVGTYAPEHSMWWGMCLTRGAEGLNEPLGLRAIGGSEDGNETMSCAALARSILSTYFGDECDFSVALLHAFANSSSGIRMPLEKLLCMEADRAEAQTRGRAGAGREISFSVSGLAIAKMLGDAIRAPSAPFALSNAALGVIGTAALFGKDLSVLGDPAAGIFHWPAETAAVFATMSNSADESAASELLAAVDLANLFTANERSVLWRKA